MKNMFDSLKDFIKEGSNVPNRSRNILLLDQNRDKDLWHLISTHDSIKNAKKAADKDFKNKLKDRISYGNIYYIVDRKNHKLDIYTKATKVIFPDFTSCEDITGHAYIGPYPFKPYTKSFSSHERGWPLELS
ncbi:MAG: hypothetical protein JSW73_01320 [Candidatus Woesearchaeota archaeon]|nr:MAG: hypothetical protein JSW73_01320 [Candidatus Woesearchaeota archaeon]